MCLAHQARPIQPMKICGAQRRTRSKQSLQKNKNHVNASQDHRNHRLALRANLDAVQITKRPQPDRSMKDAMFQRHVNKPNSDVAKMVFQLQRARTKRDAQSHCVRAVCSDVVHPMTKLKHKDRIKKVNHHLSEMSRNQ